MYIDPVAFALGPFEVRWYGVLIAGAVLIGVFLALKEVMRQQLDADKFMNIFLAAIPAAFIGARLYYVLFNLDYYGANPREIFAVWHGGLAIHGGLIAAFFTAFLMMRRYRISCWQGFDITAPSIVLGQAIGRWGNYFNQEAYGYAADPAKIPWAMYIDGAYRHPAFLYESVWNICIFIFLLWLRRRRNLRRGDVILSYAFLYSFGRMIIEAFRTDSLVLWGGIRAAQALSMVVIFISGALLLYRHKKSTPKEDNAKSDLH